MKTLLFLTLPCLTLFHSAAVAAALRAEGQTLKEYVWPSRALILSSAQLCWYHHSNLVCVLLLLPLGLCFLVLNLSVKGLFDENGCTDPVYHVLRYSVALICRLCQFIRTTIAPVQASDAFQWIYAGLSGVLVWALGLITELTRRRDPQSRALSVYRCICLLTCDQNTEAARRAVQGWKCSMLGYQDSTCVQRENTMIPSPVVWRSTVFYILHLPLVACSSAPAVAYVSKTRCDIVL